MPDTSSVEFSSNNPDLDIKQYDHWRDWLFNLQLGHTKLPGIENSYKFGYAGHLIGLGAVLELREGRTKDGEPYTVLVDEKTDEQVLIEASSEDKEKAFLDAIFKNVRGWVAGDTDAERQYYPTAAVVLGSALLEISPEDAKDLILEHIGSSDMYPVTKESFKKALEIVSDEKVKKLTDYLKFSQTQMTKKEDYFIKTGLKEPPPIGSALLAIGGEEYKFNGEVSGGTLLTQEDEYILAPLMASNRRSRQEMIEQAKEAARQVFDKPDGQFGNPPRWWTSRENLEGISSKQALVYAPSGGQNQENLPKVYQEIYNSSGGRGGWFLVEVEKQNGPWLLTNTIARLVS